MGPRWNPGRAVLAGFAATLMMTLLIYMAPTMGLPAMDIAAMLGSLVHGGRMPAPTETAYWIGLALHFMMGTVVFSLVYANLVYGLVRGVAWARGLIWGASLWMIMMVMAVPMMGMGFFASHTPHAVLFAMGALMGHLVYGAILGAIVGPQAERRPHEGFAGHSRPA